MRTHVDAYSRCGFGPGLCIFVGHKYKLSSMHAVLRYKGILSLAQYIHCQTEAHIPDMNNNCSWTCTNVACRDKGNVICVMEHHMKSHSDGIRTWVTNSQTFHILYRFVIVQFWQLLQNAASFQEAMVFRMVSCLCSSACFEHIISLLP